LLGPALVVLDQQADAVADAAHLDAAALVHPVAPEQVALLGQLALTGQRARERDGGADDEVVTGRDGPAGSGALAAHHQDREPDQEAGGRGAHGGLPGVRPGDRPAHVPTSRPVSPCAARGRPCRARATTRRAWTTASRSGSGTVA